MILTQEPVRPTKDQQKLAEKSFDTLSTFLENVHSENLTITIDDATEAIQVPLFSLKLFAKILNETRFGRPIEIIPIETQLTTQQAADILNCSRPHIVKLIEDGQLPCKKIGRHRRININDVLAFKKNAKEKQKQLLIEIMKEDEELELYA